MKRNIYFIAAMIVAGPANGQKVDLSPLVGTMEVEFQPVQSAGIRSGCTLVYRAVARDFAYRRGGLVGVVGNISYQRDSKSRNIILGLKVGLADDLVRSDPKLTAPFFAYIQTPNGTTAKLKGVQFDSDEPGYRNFVYQLDSEAVKVYGDIVYGESIAIGFNRTNGGIDVLVPLDLSVVESTPTATGLMRKRSSAMLNQFIACVKDVTSQVQESINTSRGGDDRRPDAK